MDTRDFFPTADHRPFRASPSPALSDGVRALTALLLAGLLCATAAPVQAQSAGPASETRADKIPAMAPSPIYDNIETAFNRADINKDGRLTREEAQLLPAVDTRFDEIDADHNRFISRDEFRRAVQQQ